MRLWVWDETAQGSIKPVCVTMRADLKPLPTSGYITTVLMSPSYCTNNKHNFSEKWFLTCFSCTALSYSWTWSYWLKCGFWTLWSLETTSVVPYHTSDVFHALPFTSLVDTWSWTQYREVAKRNWCLLSTSQVRSARLLNSKQTCRLWITRQFQSFKDVITYLHHLLSFTFRN